MCQEPKRRKKALSACRRAAAAAAAPLRKMRIHLRFFNRLRSERERRAHTAPACRCISTDGLFLFLSLSSVFVFLFFSFNSRSLIAPRLRAPAIDVELLCGRFVRLSAQAAQRTASSSSLLPAAAATLTSALVDPRAARRCHRLACIRGCGGVGQVVDCARRARRATRRPDETRRRLAEASAEETIQYTRTADQVHPEILRRNKFGIILQLSSFFFQIKGTASLETRL